MRWLRFWCFRLIPMEDQTTLPSYGNFVPLKKCFRLIPMEDQTTLPSYGNFVPLKKVFFNGDCPMFRRSYIQKVLCSEGPMFRKYLFKRSYIQKVLCSEGPIFRYIQKVLYSENSLFDVGKNLHLSVSGKLQCKITNHSLSFQLIRSKFR